MQQLPLPADYTTAKKKAPAPKKRQRR